MCLIDSNHAYYCYRAPFRETTLKRWSTTHLLSRIWKEREAWASYQTRKNRQLRMRQELRERFPHHRLQRKSPVSDPDMHHGTCTTHVPWCMLGSLTRGGGENVPGIPGACNFTYLVSGPSKYQHNNKRLPVGDEARRMFINTVSAEFVEETSMD